ncbi:hypothetical protein DRW48_01735 [Paracoccus suum]|uniref:Uncharacterized protein n=1 Tax=Paracoccus suum TaxID=2259340 RepID=A0A344PGT1_9RHOB|nr:DUF6478 family protein [Paracoccus suum]AXC48586.1 hypothetical protein DRW48_01735 [Paracoccus suum]
MARRGPAATLGKLLGRGAGGGDAGHWRGMRTAALSTAEIDRLRGAARDQRRAIDAFLASTERATRRHSALLAAMPLPAGTDWRWRPPLLSTPLDPAVRIGPPNGEGLGDSAQLFHDCDLRAMILRQVPNLSATDLALYGLRLEVLGFSGGFLALSLPLPAEALDGLDRDHIIRLETEIEIERRIEVFARLNIKNGPNTDQQQAHLGWMQADRRNRHVSEFDLAPTEINPERLESAWLDLIFEAPAMNAVVLRDLVLSRHRRAQV